MGNLPELVVSRILFYLNLDITDKFRLRLVCKSWKGLIDFQIGRKKSLCVYESLYNVHEPTYYAECDGHRMISRSDVVSQTLFENRLSHFWCIKRLVLHRTRRESFSCKEVLSKLVELLSGGLVELSLFLTDLLMKSSIELDRLSFSALKTLRNS